MNRTPRRTIIGLLLLLGDARCSTHRLRQDRRGQSWADLAEYRLIDSISGPNQVLSNPEMSLKQGGMNLFKRRVFGRY